MAAWAVLACLGATLCYALAASFTHKYLSGLTPDDRHRQPDRRHAGPGAARAVSVAGAHARPQGLGLGRRAGRAAPAWPTCCTFA
jgi:hypothetical protein